MKQKQKKFSQGIQYNKMITTSFDFINICYTGKAPGETHLARLKMPVKEMG